MSHLGPFSLVPSFASGTAVIDANSQTVVAQDSVLGLKNNLEEGTYLISFNSSDKWAGAIQLGVSVTATNTATWSPWVFFGSAASPISSAPANKVSVCTTSGINQVVLCNTTSNLVTAKFTIVKLI
jgi:hypothetical protein